MSGLFLLSRYQEKTLGWDLVVFNLNSEVSCYSCCLI